MPPVIDPTMTNVNPDHVLWEDGKENMGGIQTILYWAPNSAFLAIQAIPLEPTTFEGAVAIATDHTFNDGEGFRKLYCTPKAGSVLVEKQGEIDGASYSDSVTVFMPGGEKEVQGFAAYINNTNAIFLVKDQEGRVRQIGSEEFPARVETGSFTTGESGEDRKGMELTVMADSRRGAPFYEGVITEFDEESSSSS